LAQILGQVLEEGGRVHGILRIGGLGSLTLLLDSLLHQHLRLYVQRQGGQELGIHLNQRVVGNLDGILLRPLTDALHAQMLAILP